MIRLRPHHNLTPLAGEHLGIDAEAGVIRANTDTMVSEIPLPGELGRSVTLPAAPLAQAFREVDLVGLDLWSQGTCLLAWEPTDSPGKMVSCQVGDPPSDPVVPEVLGKGGEVTVRAADLCRLARYLEAAEVDQVKVSVAPPGLCWRSADTGLARGLLGHQGDWTVPQVLEYQEALEAQLAAVKLLLAEGGHQKNKDCA